VSKSFFAAPAAAPCFDPLERPEAPDMRELATDLVSKSAPVAPGRYEEALGAPPDF